MNKFKRLIIIPILILLFALPLALTSCVMDYRVSELPQKNMVKRAKAVTASSASGKYAVDSSVTTSWSPKNTSGEWLNIEFKNEVTFNAVALKEKEGVIKIFKLQIPDGDSWKTVYYSDGIGKYRLCSFETVTTSQLRFSVDNAFDKFSIRELAVYYIENPPIENFKKTAFVSVDKYRELSSARSTDLKEYLEFYDDIILTDAVTADGAGNLNYALSTEELTGMVSTITAGNKAKASINVVNNTAVNPINTKPDCDNLVINLIKLCTAAGATGITLEWRELVGAELWRAYNFLINNLSKEFKKIKTSSDSAPSLSIILENARAELEGKTCRALDNVYFFGSPSTSYTEIYNDFYNNFYYAINLLSNIGFDKSKIIITLPLFAHSVSSHNGIMPYSQLVAQNGNVNIWQNLYINLEHGSGYRDFYFQSVALAHDKAIYSRTLGLGGFGIVGLAFDLPMSNRLSITASIAKALA